MLPLRKTVFAVSMALVLGLSGCESGPAAGTAAPSPEPTETARSCWVIQIDQTVTAPYLGELGDQDQIMSENTMELIATNYNDSPYDGVFTGTAYITSHTDAKKEFGVANADYLELTNRHEAPAFTFTLKSTGVIPLTTGQDKRLHYVSNSHFLMPTKGDNPASVRGAAQGYQFAQGGELDFSLTCDMRQSDHQITLNTDMFGKFEGTLVWTDQVPELPPPPADES